MSLDETGLEPEWDDQMSGQYHDGYDQGQADARSGIPYEDRPSMAWAPAAWTEGYRDGHEDIERRRQFRAGLRGGSGG